MAALLHRGGAPRDCSFHFSGTRSILSGKGLWVWHERACANVARKAAECLQGVCGPLSFAAAEAVRAGRSGT